MNNTNTYLAGSLTGFIDYCLSYYGANGIYDMASEPMTHSQAYHACELISATGNWMGGDTLDREAVLKFCYSVYGTALA